LSLTKRRVLKKMSSKKYVYSFGGGKADGNESMKNLLGGKGANLAEMAGHKDLKLPVPRASPLPPRFAHIITRIKRLILRD